ncbi:MAG: TIGR03087 family PEP-CTERM/XrtA system glycosyltransferase [Marichromatium sp.]|nr:TIGR03087 family PEP-CTERM/XrtA system glycosyltransferase [Marichromatium sp.]
MDDLLFLVHRIPYPPNKGDKIRSFHLLRFLSEHYRVHLATFIDQPEDRVHRARVAECCVSSWFGTLDPRRDKLLSLRGLLGGEPLTLTYYRDRALRRWLRETRARHAIGRVLAFSSSMGQYLFDPACADLRRVIDLVDVDSEKWRQYAAESPPPMRWVYAREARRLGAFERRLATACDASTLVSEAEAALFRERLDDASARVEVVGNGVDTAHFAVAPGTPSPYPDLAPRLVFTGAMDYWANAQGAAWFAEQVLPRIRARRADAEFWVVGMNPTRAVRQLGRLPGVVVTGAVPDVRPYLQHAAAAVVPLHIARGIQNKVLEAMAMARPVIATPQALEGIPAAPGREARVAEAVEPFAAECLAALATSDDPMGAQGRALVERHFAWEATLPRLVELLEGGS